jgi:hypothetical protein
VNSHTPTFGATVPATESPFSRVSSEVHQPHVLAASAAFEPKRSSLVAWTVRMAQVADRIIARTFPSSFLNHVQSKGLVEKTLNGLDRCFRLIPTHQGVVAVERARLQIQQVLNARRERYRRFQGLRQAMVRDTFSHSDSYLHLNPVCRWIRISDELVSDRECPSGSVLFFLANNDVHGLRMSLEGQVLINELADYQPCTVLQWAQLSSLADIRQIDVLVRHLAEIGLVAWGTE